jgi:hypothetical protein
MESVLPRELSELNEGLTRENFKERLTIPSVECQAARILVVKEFKVLRALPNKREMTAVLVLSIDKYLGCWDKLDQKVIDSNVTHRYVDTEKPVFHQHIDSLSIKKTSTTEVEIMPTKHVLFVNVCSVVMSVDWQR